MKIFVICALFMATTLVAQEKISDKRVAQNVLPMDSTLPIIMGLTPVTFTIAGSKEQPSIIQWGFIAQDSLKAMPMIAHPTGPKTAEAPDGLLQIDYQPLVPILVRAMQAQQADITKLQHDVVTLREEIDQLKKDVKK